MARTCNEGLMMLAGEADRKGAERIRWRCRRGMLELDIVLGRFIERYYASLDEAQLASFDVLLDMPDTTLWDMITGRVSPQQRELAAVLAMINAV